MHLVAIGGSDAGISAALRARELDPTTEVTVVVADAYPNFSICGIPYYVSGEVTHWRNLAHRTLDDLKATGMQVRLNTLATKIDVLGRRLHVVDESGVEDQIAYDQLVVGTGAVSARPPIEGLVGPDALGPADGVHLLHSMGDTFELMRTLEEDQPASAVIVGAGYIGLEMAEGLQARGLSVTQFEQLPEVLPTVDPSLGALVNAELDRARRRREDQHDGQADRPGARGFGRPLPGRCGRVVGCRADRLRRHGAGRGRRASRHRPGRRRRGRARHRRCHQRGPGHADQPRARLRRRGLRRDPPPPDGPHLPARSGPRPTSRAGWPARTPSGASAEFAGSLGTQVVKVFDMVASRTGLRDHEATRRRLRPGDRRVRGRRPQGVLPGQPPDPHALHRRPHDRPTARRPALRSPHAEVAKRIDIAATAIFNEMTVDAMSELDLSYTPPLGSPWDAVQMGAQAWVRAAESQRRNVGGG